MSIKTFHIIFISLSSLLCFGYGVWSLNFAKEENIPGYSIAGFSAFLIGCLLIFYGIKFYKKIAA